MALSGQLFPFCCCYKAKQTLEVIAVISVFSSLFMSW